MKVQGLAAIVTGGASGLGAATGKVLKEAGAKVALFDRNADLVAKVAKDIGAVGIACDVADEAAAKAGIAKAREANGVCRILINCAGIGGAERIVGKDGPQPLANYERIIRVNLIGTFNMMRLIAADMIPGDALNADGERGVIVNTASVGAYEGQIGQAAYGASKGGVVSMTLPAAREFAQFGIRVMTIAPGVFDTMIGGAQPPERKAAMGAMMPFPKRLGLPEEFGRLALHCAENPFLNGEVIRIDAALRLGPRW